MCNNILSELNHEVIKLLIQYKANRIVAIICQRGKTKEKKCLSNWSTFVSNQAHTDCKIDLEGKKEN